MGEASLGLGGETSSKKGHFTLYLGPWGGFLEEVSPGLGLRKTRLAIGGDVGEGPSQVHQKSGGLTVLLPEQPLEQPPVSVSSSIEWA